MACFTLMMRLSHLPIQRFHNGFAALTRCHLTLLLAPELLEAPHACFVLYDAAYLIFLFRDFAMDLLR